MRTFRKTFLNLALFAGCLFLMSSTEPESVDSPSGGRTFWGWGSMGCAPTGGNAPSTELTCTQCYYVFWVGVDCRTCINYLGSSSNTECRNN